jgi:hypothetical protein
MGKSSSWTAPVAGLFLEIEMFSLIADDHRVER